MMRNLSLLLWNKFKFIISKKLPVRFIIFSDIILCENKFFQIKLGMVTESHKWSNNAIDYQNVSINNIFCKSEEFSFKDSILHTAILKSERNYIIWRWKVHPWYNMILSFKCHPLVLKCVRFVHLWRSQEKNAVCFLIKLISEYFMCRWNRVRLFLLSN